MKQVTEKIHALFSHYIVFLYKDEFYIANMEDTYGEMAGCWSYYIVFLYKDEFYVANMEDTYGEMGGCWFNLVWNNLFSAF